MNNKMFRNLNADEIEVRVGQNYSNNKCSLLLYQNARVAMDILDETLGPLGWSCTYKAVNDMLFCEISIRTQDGSVVTKSDTGSAGNFEPSKSLASDSFKRAAVKFGIARSLYSAPKVIVDLTDKDMFNGKVSMTFKVSEIGYDENDNISRLTIVDRWGNVRFTYGG